MKKNMKKKIILFLFFGFWFLSYGQQVNYLGNNKLHNFSINITNQSDSIFLYTLKQGQIIHSENLDFVVASNRNFWIEAKSIKIGRAHV